MRKTIDRLIKENDGALGAQVIIPFVKPMVGSVTKTDEDGVYTMLIMSETPKGTIPVACFFTGDKVLQLIPVPKEMLPQMPDLGSKKSSIILDGN